MSSWQIQDAKSRFTELLDAAIKKGPQVITRAAALRLRFLFPFNSGVVYKILLALALRSCWLGPTRDLRI